MSDTKGYRVDADHGIVYGLRGNPIKCRDVRGYVIVSNKAAKFAKKAHRMVWESVHGPIPDGFEINHINGIRDDNRIVNLELATRSENVLHSFRIGLHIPVKGDKHWKTKLTSEQVLDIRSSSLSAKELAEKYAVSKSCIYRIISRKFWSHV